MCLSFSLVFLVLQVPGVAQDKAAKIDELMNLYHEYGQFNGTVLVSEGGKVIYKRGFGLANVEWNIPNEPDTKFRLASITKQFTSMLIMQLVERGKIDLNGKITDYLPDYRKDTGDKITIHHLLTHTSGIPNYEQEFWADKARDPLTIEQMVADFCIGDLEFEIPERRNRRRIESCISLDRSFRSKDKLLRETVLNEFLVFFSHSDTFTLRALQEKLISLFTQFIEFIIFYIIKAGIL